MSKDDAFRFAVGSPDNLQSWIWRFWIHKNEVYLGAKDALHVFKVSLHHSGIWRIAFVADLERDDPSKDRVIIKWNKPEEFTVGWTPSVALLVSSIQPKVPLNSKSISDSRIHWFDPPPENKKMLFKVLFSKSGTENYVDKILIPGDKIVTKIKKKNDEIVWIILRYSDLTAIEIAKTKDVIKNTKIHLVSDSSEKLVGSTRALLLVSEDVPMVGTQPTIFDISLGKENLEIPTNS